MENSQNLMEKIVSLSKRRGFIFPGSEIYGGVANTYDYGPVGAELLRNIRNLWWDFFISKSDDVVGIDASVISHQQIWQASGHTAGFADALIDCKNCKLRMRADHLIEESLQAQKVEGLSEKELEKIIKEQRIVCPNCGKFNWTQIRRFNLLFPVKLGIVEGDQSLAYLRGETAQGMFINFKNVVDSTRVKLPFGIAQLGKSFRNEITPGNSIFRTLEFEQGEIEYFFDPKNSDWEKLFLEWKEKMLTFATVVLGISKEKLKWREHTDAERSFYSRKTEDLEYEFPFGYKELWGIAYRTDYDLKQHAKFSKTELSIVDPKTNKKIMPHVIEPAVGINRLFLTVLCDAYSAQEGRIVLKLSPKVAPFKAAVFPLLANKPQLVEKAHNIYLKLKRHVSVYWDDRGNIGKRYLYQDEIGTPYSLTIDFQTLADDTITVRDRDSAKQVRIKADSVSEFIKSKLNG